MRAISTTSPKTPPPASSPAPSTKSATSSLPHLTPSSEIHLISTSAKSVTHRVAVAVGHVCFSNHEPLRLIRQNSIKKGDVLAVARIAAIQAVKKTSDFIPLAHGGVPVEGCIARVEPVGPSRSDPQPESPASSREERKIEEAMRLSGPIGTFGGVRISVQVETTAKTGVEMEALTGVVGAALTVVDMCKSVDKGCVVSDVKVTGKKGGLSGGLGIWRRGLSGGSKELRDWKLSEREGGMVKGSMRVVDEGSDKVEKEDVCEQAAENERLRKAKTCKRWTRDLIPE